METLEFTGVDYMEDVYVGYLAEGETCPACKKDELLQDTGICRKCEIEIFE